MRRSRARTVATQHPPASAMTGTKLATVSSTGTPRGAAASPGGGEAGDEAPPVPLEGPAGEGGEPQHRKDFRKAHVDTDPGAGRTSSHAVDTPTPPSPRPATAAPDRLRL